jgi:hypothetical protein
MASDSSMTMTRSTAEQLAEFAIRQREFPAAALIEAKDYPGSVRVSDHVCGAAVERRIPRRGE